MRKLHFATSLAVAFALWAAAAAAQQAPAAPTYVPPPFPSGWTGKEFNGLPPMIREAEDFINENCQPANLNNIQIMNMQKGHGQPINIHVYCRQDRSASAHYNLSLVPVVARRLEEALFPLLGRPNSRIVGFYFGKEGEDDGIMVLGETK